MRLQSAFSNYQDPVQCLQHLLRPCSASATTAETLFSVCNNCRDLVERLQQLPRPWTVPSAPVAYFYRALCMVEGGAHA
eukprot:357277-Chlamydomonas_euryale.AAC.2